MNTASLYATDYGRLRPAMAPVIEALAGDGYRACVDALIRLAEDAFPALAYATNPVVLRSGEWRAAELRRIIEEYSGFSNAAIHMFLEARIRNRRAPLTAEIVRNMDEEMGALTRGVPHLELMREGYRAELGIETDGLVYSPVTRAFVSRISSLFRTGDNVFLAGALLAFETTATDEFRVVEHMLKRYKALIGGTIEPGGPTHAYIEGHVCSAGEGAVDPEMEHFEGMLNAVGDSVGGDDLRPLIRGFLSVCLELNQWWESVVQEILGDGVRRALRAPAAAMPATVAAEEEEIIRVYAPVA